FCLVALALYISPFGARRKHDGLLRFQIPSGPESQNRVTTILQNQTKRFILVTMRDVAQGTFFDYAYQVKLSRSEDNQLLMSELEKVAGIRGLSYTNQETTVEV
ncbi:DUF4956 domain-containing protein, partial [bacterium]|nr:DUF4956 domain-containing protein [bacterium]